MSVSIRPIPIGEAPCGAVQGAPGDVHQDEAHFPTHEPNSAAGMIEHRECVDLGRELFNGDDWVGAEHATTDGGPQLVAGLALREPEEPGDHAGL